MCALTQTGWAGRGHGSLARLDPSRGTKQGGEGAVPSPPKSKTRFRIGIRSKRLDPFWWCRGSQGAKGEGGGGEELKTIIGASEDWAG